jgi:hypothetical protein
MAEPDWNLYPVLSGIDLNEIRNGIVAIRLASEYEPGAEYEVSVNDRVIVVEPEDKVAAVGVVTEIFEGRHLNRWYARIRLK